MNQHNNKKRYLYEHYILLLTLRRAILLQYATSAPFQPSLLAHVIRTSRKLVPAH